MAQAAQPTATGTGFCTGIASLFCGPKPRDCSRRGGHARPAGRQRRWLHGSLGYCERPRGARRLPIEVERPARHGHEDCLETLQSSMSTPERVGMSASRFYCLYLPKLLINASRNHAACRNMHVSGHAFPISTLPDDLTKRACCFGFQTAPCA